MWNDANGSELELFFFFQRFYSESHEMRWTSVESSLPSKMALVTLSMFSLFSPLNSMSCCDWPLVSCNFRNDILEQSEQPMPRGCVKKLKCLWDTAVISNDAVEEKSVVVAR
jgi:hypothetical protein